LFYLIAVQAEQHELVRYAVRARIDQPGKAHEERNQLPVPKHPTKAAPERPNQQQVGQRQRGSHLRRVY
jgi:hypothetical protein